MWPRRCTKSIKAATESVAALEATRGSRRDGLDATGEPENKQMKKGNLVPGGLGSRRQTLC